MLVAIIRADHENAIERLSLNLPSNIELAGAPTLDDFDRLTETEGLFTFWYPPQDQIPKVRWIHCANAGVENIPDSVLFNPQWKLTHGSGPAAVPMAEWTIAAMLFFAHRFRKILQHERERTWYENRPRDMSGNVLHGATVGIVGYGAIGRQTARLCKAFGMEVHASIEFHGKAQYPTYTTPGTGDPDGSVPDHWFEHDQLCDMLPKWDYVSLYLRVNEKTHHIINAKTLKHFKPTAVLINAARGALVDEAALIEALKAGQLGGAALDVYEREPLPPDDPLREAPNLLLSPHCAPECSFYQGEVWASMRENIRRFADGEPLLNVIAKPK